MKLFEPEMATSKIRIWPLAGITLLDSILLIVIWVNEARSGQEKVQATVLLQVVCFLSLLLWMFFFSRLSRRTRLRLSIAFLIAIIGLAAVFRIREVSGNLVPIIDWRWARNPTETMKLATKGSLKAELPATDSHSRVFASDYPQFLGPGRDARLKGLRLARDWKSRPPRELWRRSIGDGWSSFAVSSNLAITQEQRAQTELVVCYELLTGGILWSHGDAERFDTIVGGVGPRATPTVAGNRVFSLGATGALSCLDLETGQEVWGKNVLEDNDALLNEWGLSRSPLVLDSLVIVSAGGVRSRSLVAYHSKSGDVIWSQGSDLAGYSSPMVATLAGIDQVLIFNDISVVAHRPDDGEVLWRYPWPSAPETVAQPVVVSETRVLIASGYGVGSKLLELRRDKDQGLIPILVWESNRLKPKFTNVVHHEGYLYGLDDGILACIDVSKGKRRWKRGRYGHGQVLLVEDLLLVQAESGEVVLVEATPAGHKELSRLEALGGKTWNNPALAGPYLLVRNNREAACYELPVFE